MATYDRSTSNTTLGSSPRIRCLRALLALPALCLLTTPVFGQTIGNWDAGGGDTNWTTPGNWQGGIIPGAFAGDQAIFDDVASQTITLDAGQTLGSLTFSNGTKVIEGANSITLDNTGFGGVGELTFNGPFNYTISSDIGLVNGVNIDIGAGGIARLNGVISGNGNLTKNGVGELVLSGANTYDGNTVINAGRLRLGAADVITDSSAVVLAGELHLNGNSETIGSLAGNGTVTLTDQTLTVGNDNTNTIFGGAINGTGSLVKTGTGTFTLNGARTYSGGTTISGGTVVIDNNGSLGGGLITFDDGTLQMAGALDLANNAEIAGGGGTISNTADTAINGDFSGTGTLTKEGGGDLTLRGDISGFTGPIVLNAGNLNIANNNTVSGDISGNGRLTVNNGADVILSGTNTFNGGLHIIGGVGAATVRVGSADNLGNAAGGITFNAGNLLTTASIDADHAINLVGRGTVDTNGFDSILSGAISGAGDFVKAGGGNLTLRGAITHNGITSIDSGRLVIDTGNGNRVLTGQVVGIGELQVIGGNTLQLPGVNTFSGGLFIEDASTVSVSNGQGLGTDDITFDNGILRTTSGITAGNDLVINAGGGTIDTDGNNSTFGGDLTGAGDLSLTDSGDVTFNGALGGFAGNWNLNDFSTAVYNVGGIDSVSGNINGTGGIQKNGFGLLTLTGDNNYAGPTLIQNGVLAAGSANAIGDLSAVTVGNGFSFGNPRFDLVGQDETIGSLAGIAASRVVLDNATLTTGGNDFNTTFNGVLIGNENSVLVKTGIGEMILTGDNTFEGTLRIEQGAIRLTDAGGIANNVLANRNRVNIFTDAELRLTNLNETIGGLEGNGDVQLGANTLTVNSEAPDGSPLDTTFSGRIFGTGGLTKAGGGVLTLSGANEYTGDTTINAGTLQLGADDRIADTSDIIVDNTLATNATLDLNNFNERIATLSGNGFVTLGTGTLVTGGGNFSGVISGDGGLTNDGGTLILDGANTYTGVTRVAGGTIRLGASNVIADGSIVRVDGGAFFNLDGNNDTVANITGSGTISLGAGTLTAGGDNTDSTFSGNITGTGGLTKVGTARLTLTGAPSYSGSTMVQGGILQAGAAGMGAFAGTTDVTLAAGTTFEAHGDNTIGSLASTATDSMVNLVSGTLTTGTDNTDTVFAGIISGAGNLTKTGTGTFELTGANTYTGGTTLNNGILLISMDNALGDTGPGIGELTFNGGTLGLGADLTTARDITINVGGGTIDTRGFNGTLSGIISGDGALTKTGDGTLTLSGVNTYLGGTNINQGTVSVSNNNNLGNDAGPIRFSNGGMLETTASISGTRGLEFGAGGGIINTGAFNASFSGAVTGAGGLTKNGAGTLTLGGSLAGYTGDTTINAGILAINTNAGDTTHVGSISGAGMLHKDGLNTLTLAGSLDGLTGNISINGGTLNIDTAAGDTTVAGSIGGVGNLTKSGANVLQLNGNNTYTGTTMVNAGTLRLGVNNALADETAVTVAAGAILDVNGQTDTIGSLAGAGNVTLGAGALTAGADNSDTTFSGVISGNGSFTKTGTGTMTLSGVNTHTGGTNLNGGTVVITNDNNLGAAAGPLSFDNGTLRTDADVTSARTVTLNGGGGTINTNGNNATLSGPIGGIGALTKTGNGTLTLSGANSYSGGTNINGGTVSVGADINLGNANGPLSFDNGTLLLTGDLFSSRAVTLNAGGGTFNTNGNNASFTGQLSGPGGLTKDGAGNLRFGGSLSTYTGNTVINAGSLELAGGTTHAGAISGAGNLIKSGNNTLVVQGTLNGFTGDVELAAGTLNVDTSNGSTAIVGDISGAGGLTKSGGNTLLLSGNNTWTGDTLIAGGILQLGSATAIGDNSAVTVASGATLDVNNFTEIIGSLAGAGNVDLGAGGLATGRNNSSTVFSGIISGTGVLVKEGTGTMTLSGINTYTGPTLITGGGALSISSDANLGNAAAALGLDNGTLIVTSGITSSRAVTLGAGNGTVNTVAGDSVFSGMFTGPGSLTKQGIGSLTLSGVNNYTGGTHINGGTLIISDNNNLGDPASGLSFDTGTLQTNGTVDNIRDVALNAGGGTINTNGNSSTFGGVFSGPGSLTKNGTGTLTLTGNSTYTGPTTVNGGRLDVNGQITSNTIVNTGATLGGNGTIVGNVTINDGATNAPGNSIGQNNIVGNYTQSTGSIFELELRPAARGAETPGVDFDQTNVTGVAVIQPGATVNVIPEAGTYQLGNRFRFLDTTGGVTGMYDTLTGASFNGGLLQGSLIHNTDSVDLLINRTNFSNVSGTTTKNQRLVAQAIDQLSVNAGNNPASDATGIINQLLGMNQTQRNTALSQLGGASHGANQLVALQTTYEYLRSVRNRIRTGLINQTPTDDHPVWVEGLALFGTFDSDSNASGVDYDGGGIVFGIDQGLDEGRQGLAVGITSVDTDNLNGYDSGTIESYNFTAYSSTIADPVYLLGVIGYGRNHIDSTRQLSALTPSRTAGSSAVSSQLMALLEYGLFAKTELWDVQVFLSGQYVGLQRDSFTEYSANAANLQIGDESSDSFRAMLGMRVAGQLTERFSPELHVGLIHEFLDPDTDTTATFNGSGISFTQCGVKLPQNLAQVGAGGTLILGSGFSLYGGYDAMLSSQQNTHAVNGSLIYNY